MMNDIKHFIDFHNGQDFLVVGNGPSVLQYDPEFYTNFGGVTIGVNRILDYFNPTYYVNVEVKGRINWEMPQEVNSKWIAAKSSSQPRANITFDWAPMNGVFFTEKDGLVSCGHGSPFIATSIAYQMGAKRIYLIGVDFTTGDNRKIYFSDHEEHPSQWYLDDNGIDDPMRENSLKYWRQANDSLKNMGVELINLSKISKLDFIDKGEL